MVLTQTVVDIPENRRVHLDWDLEIPREIPFGKAKVELKVVPFSQEEEKEEPPLKCLRGVKTPRSDRLLGVAANLGDITLDEIRDEWITEKYLK